ncbi:MAG TPA: Ku protein [Rhizomicrobium sp.]|jgi:DNA end-binding protein Ku
MARARKKAKAKTQEKSHHPIGRGGPRPSWQGHLRLSLVSCPVALYNATTRTRDVSFHLLNPKTHNRIRMIPTDPDSGPVERADLVKGYEVSKNEYVVVTNEELDAVKLETTRTIDIERFVEADSIDRLYWNDPYYLVPNGGEGEEAFGVIREAMKKAGRIALGRVVMHTRERLLGIEPRDEGLLAYTLRMDDEVVASKPLFSGIETGKPDRKMIEIATKIIEQKEGPFDPSGFKDRYESALRDLIKRKQKGQKPITAEPPEDTNVIDLMAALKKSLKGKAKVPTARHPANENKKRASKR